MTVIRESESVFFGLYAAAYACGLVDSGFGESWECDRHSCK
jgi:hypothetical protein